jgi:hypothetical protein
MKILLATAIAATLVISPPTARGAPPLEVSDRLEYRFAFDSHLLLHERAYVTSPGGELVAAPRAPWTQTARFEARDIDVPWRKDSIDLELSSWGTVDMGGPASDGAFERRLDGDISTAFVRHRLGAVSFTLGRQLRAGGAARLIRFDGGSVAARAPWGTGIDVYGGLTVLPRWDQQMGYHLLGSAVALLRDPSLVERIPRSGEWLVGARAHQRVAAVGEIGVSFHEQRHRGAIDRRELGLDLRMEPHRAVTATGLAVVDVDSWQPSDLSLALDTRPTRALDLFAEITHVVPALRLSRQSVLAVFSTDAVVEVGGGARLRLAKRITIHASGYADRFDARAWGGRGAIDVAIRPERVPVRWSARYGRVREPTGGYHQLRVAMGVTPLRPLELTCDAHAYLYDRPIAGVARSLFTSMTGSWRFDRRISALLGGSLAHTPLSSFEAQAFARLSIELDGVKP